MYLNRNLRFNRLKKLWRATFSRETPALVHLDITGNTNYTLHKRTLKNSTLKWITGATISENCEACNLTRQNGTMKKNLPEKGCVQVLNLETRTYGGQCSAGYCKLVVSAAQVRRTNRCHEFSVKLQPVEYFLGCLSVLLNSAVFITVLSTRSLRVRPSFVLLAHMAFCDFLFGVYSIGIATVHNTTSVTEVRQWRRSICPHYRWVFLLAQVMGVCTAVLVSTERYFTIVWWTKPDIEITQRTSLVTLAIMWTLAVILCFVLEALKSDSVILDTFMCIPLRNADVGREFLFSQGVVILAVVIYFVPIFLYIRIYQFAKRSAASTGIQRETKLAKKIGTIVLTNVVFFVVPNLLMFVVSFGNLDISEKPLINFTVRKWLPPILMVVNACLNPCIYAYKNRRFTNALKHSLFCLGGTVQQAFQRLRRGKPKTTPITGPQSKNTASFCEGISLQETPGSLGWQ